MSLCLLYAFVRVRQENFLAEYSGQYTVNINDWYCHYGFVVRREKSKTRLNCPLKIRYSNNLLYLLIPILLTVAAMIFIPMKGYNLIDFLVKITSSDRDILWRW